MYKLYELIMSTSVSKHYTFSCGVFTCRVLTCMGVPPVPFTVLAVLFAGFCPSFSFRAFSFEAILAFSSSISLGLFSITCRERGKHGERHPEGRERLKRDRKWQSLGHMTWLQIFVCGTPDLHHSVLHQRWKSKEQTGDEPDIDGLYIRHFRQLWC